MIQYTDGYKYQLHKECEFVLPEKFKQFWFDSSFFSLRDGVLRFREGYAWDGPSGPTIDSKSGMRASLVHDGLYQAIRADLLPRSFKADADQLLYDLCVQDGMFKVRAWLWYRAVVRFGLSATIRNKDIRVAP